MPRPDPRLVEHLPITPNLAPLVAPAASAAERHQAELDAIIEATKEIWSVDAAASEAWEAARKRDERRVNLRVVEGAITDDDIERLVHDKVDTFAARVVKAFLLATKAPSTPEKPATRYCWLAGPTGYGKTVAACWAIAEERGRYMTAEQLRRAFCQETKEAAELREYATRCHLLVVDDIGTERNAAEIADSRTAMFQLVNARQGKGRITILTGNLSEETIRKHYDTRTIERIEHQGKIVTVRGRDLRHKPQGEPKQLKLAGSNP